MGEIRDRESADIRLCDIYKEYIKDTPKEDLVDEKTFITIVKVFGNKLYDKLLYESCDVRLPSRVGVLTISKNKTRINLADLSIGKTNRLRVDWKATKALGNGKKVFHLNEHRGGFQYGFQWRRHKTPLSQIYVFRPLRCRMRELAYILQNRPEIDYFNTR